MAPLSPTELLPEKPNAQRQAGKPEHSEMQTQIKRVTQNGERRLLVEEAFCLTLVEMGREHPIKSKKGVPNNRAK